MTTVDPNSIAIVGLAGHFPGAKTPDELWRLIQDGREATHWLSDEELLAAGVAPELLSDPHYVRATLPLPDMELFDAAFFGLSPQEARIMDPQHRHFLECCWEALEDAGHVPSRFPGSIGVFGGCGQQAYFANNLLGNPALMHSVGAFLVRHTGNDKDFLTTRVSYLLDLKGPSLSIQTACSTSLVAVHVACQSLLNGECDMALAGGASIELPHRQGYVHAPGEILSADGHCRAFDDSATGTLFGSGAGIVVLRRLSDAIEAGDNIHAVIRGTSVNNDGATKAGYLAPSVEGQTQAAAEALAVSGVDAASVGLIETHGTGTVIGDPIELEALGQAYTDAGTGAIRIGSVKSNIGHLDTAAGVASLIKAVFALKRRQLPATLNCATPNTRIDWSRSPFRVQQATQPWKRGAEPRRAAVNSLGVGGTNAHAILEEAPEFPDREPSVRAGWELITMSAKSAGALDGLRTKWSDFLTLNHDDLPLADAAFTTHEGRSTFAHRVAIAADTPAGLRDALADPRSKRLVKGVAGESPPSIVFMFPGGGAQFPGAGSALYENETAFRTACDACFAALPPEAPADLKELMFGAPGRAPDAAQKLASPLHSVLAVFIVEYALTALWRTWGIEPAGVIGHSAGDYAAAVSAGIMSLEDALALVTLRGCIFRDLPPGAMLSVSADAANVRERLEANLDIAAVNGPDQTVVSGSVAEIEKLHAALQRDGIHASRIRIDVAAHSRMLDEALTRFRAGVDRIALREPKIRFMSNLSAEWAIPSELLDPGYWVRHLRNTVLFGPGLTRVLDEPNTVLLEVGPGQALSALASGVSAKHKPLSIISSSRHASEPDDDRAVLLSAAGALWTLGAPVSLPALRGPGARRRISLPTYAFEKDYFWIEPDRRVVQTATASADATLSGADAAVVRMPAEQWFSRYAWQQDALPVVDRTSARRALVFFDGSPVTKRLIDLMRDRGDDVMIAETGKSFAVVDAGTFRIDPAASGDYAQLVEALTSRREPPDLIVHAWSLAQRDAKGSDRKRGFDSLFHLAHAMAAADWTTPAKLMILATGITDAGGATISRPELAGVLGPARVLPRELPGITASVIDLTSSAVDAASAAAGLLRELDAETTDSLIALRGADRYVERAQSLTRKSSPSSRIKERGVYVVTGANGGLGQLLAHYLAGTFKAKLVLIARNPIGYTGSLVAAGAEVVTFAADVTNEAEMASAIATARERFGAINGVFHLAALLDDAPIAAKSLENAHRVMAAKANGAALLDRLLPEGTIDLFAVFSSTSARLAPAGQIDYAAANAIAEAYATRRADGLALTWGIWSEIGMAARAAAGEPAGAASEIHVDGGARSLRGEREEDSNGKYVFQAELSSASHWVLREHRIGRSAVLPGTGYLSIVRSSLSEIAGIVPIEITGANFIEAMTFAPGQRKTVRTTVEDKNDGAFSVTIESRSLERDDWAIHFQATVRAAAIATSGARSAGTVDVMPGPSGAELTPIQHGIIDFGPRWHNITSLQKSDGVVTASLELPQPYVPELRNYPAHPALMDIAMTLGVNLVGRRAGEMLYVPMSIGRTVLHAPLTRSLVATARLRETVTEDLARFDVEVLSREGTILASFEDLAMRAVPSSRIAGTTAAQTPIDRLLRAGLRAADAPVVFGEAFSTQGRQITISAVSLPSLASMLPKAEPARRIRKSASEALAAPAYANAVEEAIASMMGDILGIETVRPQDEFLALGGHSLAGVRLFARIRKRWGVELPLAALFEAPDLRQLAELVSEKLAPADAVQSSASRAESKPAPIAPHAPSNIVELRPQRRRSSGWSPLVRIAAGPANRKPLYWIHGAAGNVISIKPLAEKLRTEFPLFGLQAHGVDGKMLPQEKIEDMAVSYVAAIRSVDPVGPYCLLGYSGGGVIAYEMAQQFAASGQRVALLAMIDTLAPNRSVRMRTADWLRYGRQRGKTAFFEQLRGGLSTTFDDVVKQVRTRFFGPDQRDPMLETADRIYEAYLRAQSRYVTMPYAGDMLLFRAIRSGVAFHLAGHTLGWGETIKGQIEVHEIDADHGTIITPPAIDMIADVIAARLHAVDGDSAEAEPVIATSD